MPIQKVKRSYKSLYEQENIPELRYDFEKADRFMLVLIGLHWLLVSTFGGYFYDMYRFGFISGGLLFFVTYLGYRYYRGTSFYRIMTGIVLLSFSIILIQQSLGRIEMHFHVFIALSFLAAYKDLKPVAVAALYTIIHHLVFNYLQMYNVELFGTPIMVFNYGCGLDIVMLHAFFVVFELLVMIRVIQAIKRRFLELVFYKNEVQEMNQNLEEIVEERTAELAAADVDGDERPQEGRADMGADEYVPAE
ncbi:MAG: hypothetical protein R3302_08815 [Sulfurimonadaceae bacterium]|nr:hypothetical protein [Sulfurimonadaceae bacterium]